jgi:transcription antitermination protein NusB
MSQQKINTKTIARIAAIQVLYQCHLNDEPDVNSLVQQTIDLYQDLEFRDDLETLMGSEVKIKPSVGYLQDLVKFALSNLSSIDLFIQKNMRTDRNKFQVPERFLGEIIQKSSLNKEQKKSYQQENPEIIDAKEDNAVRHLNIEDLPTLLLVLLRVAVCELKYFPMTPRKVIVNEYTDISSDMLTEYEVGFVNSILDNISKQGEI